MNTSIDIEKIRELARKQSIIPGDNNASLAKIVIEIGVNRHVIGVLDIRELKRFLST